MRVSLQHLLAVGCHSVLRVGPESELQAMAPPGVAIHATRVPFGAMAAEGVMDPTIPLAPVRAFAEPPHLDDRMRTIINVS